MYLFFTLPFQHQQTGCQVFSACSQTQFVDSFFVEKVLDEAKKSTCLLHLNGEVDLVNIRRLNSIADEFRTTKGIIKTFRNYSGTS